LTNVEIQMIKVIFLGYGGLIQK